MDNRHIVRAYSINEVSKMINIPSGTIRQWEKDLKGLLEVPRTQQGARYYTNTEINILKKIKEMRDKNVSKGIIRSLLEQYLQGSQDSEPTSESLAMAPQAIKPTANPPASNELQASNMEAFYEAMEAFKSDLLKEIKTEIKNEISRGNHVLADEIKGEVSHSSLVTVKELSKSIQRSNDKRKAEVHEISNVILKSSEQHSESLETLSEELLKSSEVTYERLSDRIKENAKRSKKDQQKVLDKVSQTVNETKNEIRNVSKSFDAQQEYLLDSINELKQSQEEIEKREEIFQSMISSYREVAAAKSNKKKWWQIWS